MSPSLSIRPKQKEQQKCHFSTPNLYTQQGGGGDHKHSGNATITSSRISILALLVCSILLLLLTGGLLQSWGTSPWARGAGPARHLEPLGRQPECPGVGNGVWVRATALSSWPSYLGNSLWPNSPIRNRQPNEKGPVISTKAQRFAPRLQPGLSNPGYN